MPLRRHLTGPELIWFSEPDSGGDAVPGPARSATDELLFGNDLDARAHLASCQICRTRLDALRQQETALAIAVAEQDTDVERDDVFQVDALTARMMTRLRSEVNAGVTPISSAHSVQTDELVAASYPRNLPGRRRAFRLGAAAAGLVALAASIAVLVLSSVSDFNLRSPLSTNDPAPMPRLADSTRGLATNALDTASVTRRQSPPESRPKVAAGRQLLRSTIDTVPKPLPSNPNRFVGAIARNDTGWVEQRRVTARNSVSGEIESVLIKYLGAVNARDTAQVDALYPGQPKDSLFALVGEGRRPTERFRSQVRATFLALQSQFLRQLPSGEVEVAVRGITLNPVGVREQQQLIFTFRRIAERWVISRTRESTEPPMQ